jgi:hypothetical protein
MSPEIGDDEVRDLMQKAKSRMAQMAAAKPAKKKVKEPVAELSNELLGRYKKAAGADASKADKDGNFKRGDKRFSGIVKATNKQFDNDAKKEDAAGVGIITKQNTTQDVNKSTPGKNLRAFRLIK